MTPEQRSGIENAIWLCATCATLIDRDEQRFHGELLRQWKQDHEARMAEEVGRAASDLEGFDGEIEAAAALYRETKFQAGIDRLTTLRLRKWDKLTPRQRYRTLANLGNGHLQNDEPEKAAALFVEAAFYQPDDADAQAFLALAHELGGDTSAAYRLSAELVTVRSCKRAAGTYVRCAPSEIPTSQLATTTRLWHSEREVLVSLVVRAINEKDFDLAIELAERLKSHYPNVPDGLLLHGKALHFRQRSAAASGTLGAPGRVDTAELARAQDLITEAYALAQREGLADVAAEALLTRHHVRNSLGKEIEARADLEEAFRLAPGNPEVLIARGLAARSENREVAVKLLRDAIQAGGGPPARFFLAMLLRGKANERAEALAIFRQLSEESSRLQEDALGLAFELSLQLHAQQESDHLLDLASRIDGCLHATLLAEQAIQANEESTARVHADVALEQLGKGSVVDSTRRRLAEILTRLKAHDQALPLWTSLAARGCDSPDLWSLLTSAHELGMHDLILEHCAALRENGFWLPAYVNLESSVLEPYDPDGAYRLLNAHLERHPNDKLARLRLCGVCLRTGRGAEAIIERESLPSPTDELSVAFNTTFVLHATKQYAQALSYSYDVLRAHWTDPEAHLQFFQVHVQIEPNLRPEKPTAAQLGSAVCYKEVGRETVHWAVIEDSAAFYPMLGEVRPENPLAQAVLGKAPGDTVTLSEGIEPRRIEILRVEHKYVYRWQQCGEEYQLNFPGRNEIQSFHIGDDDQPLEERFAAMIKLSDLRAEQVSDALQRYRESPLTLHALSKALGSDLITCLLGLASDESLAVRVSLNDWSRHRRDVGLVADSQRLIIAPSCIGSVLALRVEDKLASWGWKLQITPGTRDALQVFAKENLSPRERGHFGKTSGGYALEPTNLEEAASLGDRAQRLLEACSVVAARSLANIDAKKRETLITLHGHAGAETIAVATEPDAVAWSDDLTFSVTAEAYGARAVPVQSVLCVFRPS